MSSFSRVAGLLLAVAAIGLAGCGGKQGGAAAPAASDIQVTTTVVQPVAWSDTVRALGTAHARESVTLTAKVSEIVDQVHFESGQHVQAGQPLVTLRVDAQEAALGEAEATLAEAEEQYRRLEGLAGQKLVARSTLDAQRALREVAAARVRQMRSDISDRHVRAPFAGVLGIRQVSPGALLTPNATIATLDDISHMYVDFQVPESSLSAMVPGARVTATSAAWPGREFTGQVQTTDARIDPNTRAVTVRAFILEFLKAVHVRHKHNRAANLHLDLACHNFGIQEYMKHGEATDRVFQQSFTFANGLLHPGDKPGIGVELDVDEAGKYPYQTAYLPFNRLHDGTVHDW